MERIYASYWLETGDDPARAAEVIAGKISKTPGVLNTESHIAFRAYSKHDLEDAFAIGLPDAD